jgi:hypothetical protein
MSNNPPVIIELSKELAEFLMENCEANIAYGLAGLQSLHSRDLQEKMVKNIEAFKALKAALEKGMA